MSVGVSVELSGVVGVVITLYINGRAQRKARSKEIEAQREHERDLAQKKIDADKLLAEKLAEKEQIRAVELSTISTTLNDLKTRFEKETGPNSGGFREKLNNHVEYTTHKLDDLADKVVKIDESLTSTKIDVAYIKGTLQKEG